MNRRRSSTTVARSRRLMTALPPPRRGVALLLVLGVIIVAAVMGYAMLSHASLTQQVSANASHSAAAQGMAESGVNLAIYYLQNPQKWKEYPAAYPDTEKYDRDGKYWTGTNGQFVDFGSPAIGSVKVTVKRPNSANRWQYDVVAVGRVPGSALERTVNATVHVEAEYKFEHAATFTNDVTFSGNSLVGVVGQSVGNVYSNGGMAIRSGGSVVGYGVRRKTLSTLVLPTLGWAPAPQVPKVVPAPSEVRSYQTYHMPNGTSYNATVLTGVTEMGSILGTPVQKFAPTASNPSGIYYVPGNLTLKSGTEIDGTLVVQGSVSVAGTNILIRSRDGFPAMIVTGNLIFSGTVASDLNVQGVCYVGGRVDGGSLIPKFTVTGALLVAGSNPLFISSPLARLALTLDPNRTRVPDFAEIGRTPQSVRVLEWQGQ